MKVWSFCDWRISWELLGILAASAVLATVGLFLIGPMISKDVTEIGGPDNQTDSGRNLPQSISVTPTLSRFSEESQERLNNNLSLVETVAPPSRAPITPKVVTATASAVVLAEQPLSGRAHDDLDGHESPRAAPPQLLSKSTDPSDDDPLPREEMSAEDRVTEEESSLDEGGELLITGAVLTRTGRPVSGIPVTASPYRLFYPPDGRKGSVGEQQIYTDEAGLYEFENLYDGEYLLRTEAVPPYQSASKRVRAGMRQVTLIVTENGQLWVEGSVKSEVTGERLAGVTIAANSQMTLSDESGYYRLSLSRQAPGQALPMLRFSQQGYHDRELAVPMHNSFSGGPITLKEVALKPVEGIAAVTGIVESELGSAPLENVRVFLSHASGHPQLDTLTGKDGTFYFPRVAFGTYALVIAPLDGHRDYRQQGLEVGAAGVEDIRVRLEPLPLGVLTGQMVDAGGQPIRGLTLWLRSLAVRTFAGKPVTSDQSGHFEVQGVPAGEIQLSTQSEPFLQITGINFQPGEPRPIEVVVDWGGQNLLGRVVDAGGLPVPAAEVSLVWLYERNGVKSRGIRNTSTNETGTFQFATLSVGLHTLNVSASGYHRKLAEHVVGPNQTAVDVILTKKSS